MPIVPQDHDGNKTNAWDVPATVCDMSDLTSGEHWDGAVCQPSGVGYRVGRTLNIFSDNSLNSWPAGWKTGCGGPCGSGWRFRGTFIDSGDHSFFDSSAPLDSFVDFSVEVKDNVFKLNAVNR